MRYHESVDKARKVLLIAVPLLLGLFIFASATMTSGAPSRCSSTSSPSVRLTRSSVWIPASSWFALPFFPWW